MPHTGQILVNPVSGETVTFTAISEERLELELELTPDGSVPGLHVHPEQEERFEVLAGEMVFKLGFRKLVARAGDVVTVPAGRAHKFSNGGDGTTRARVTVTPALDMAELLETTCELARQGRVMRSGMPKPLALAQFTRRFQREVRAPFPPAWVQRATLAPLAALARTPLPTLSAPTGAAASQPATVGVTPAWA